MKVVIAASIEKNELAAVSKYFSRAMILTAAGKAARGLGIKIGNIDADEQLIKVYLTGAHVAGRALFLLRTKKGMILPLLVRAKKDKIGENMTFANAAFAAAVAKSVALLGADMEAGKFEIVEMPDA